MSEPNPGQPSAADPYQSDIDAVYGEPLPAPLAAPRLDFQPWHYPVKQIVRSWQWVDLTVELLKKRGAKDNTLRYFTLPGPDLLDVRALAEGCAAAGVKISYFGFDSGRVPEAELDDVRTGSWTTAESVLRQSGLIADDAIVHQDRLEDIAIETSHAAHQLGQQRAFDVVNIDACSHLAYSPEGRPSLFDALNVLLGHQLSASTDWLLFITTRADPELLGEPGAAFGRAINENLSLDGSAFIDELADCLGLSASSIDSGIGAIWSSLTIEFLKLYVIGLGKYLLQYFHGQPNHPATVELASAYTYRVAHKDPDMLALSFRIRPRRATVVAQPPTIGGSLPYPILEAAHAAQIASKASKLWDLDRGIVEDQDARSVAFDGSASLLASAGYDPDMWRAWVSEHVRNDLSTFSIDENEGR